MKPIVLIVLIRQAFARILLIIPFVLAFYTIPTPLNILAVLAIIIKLKLPSGTDTYETHVIQSYIAKILSRVSTDDEKVEWETIKKTFVIPDAPLSTDDIDGASTKITIDIIADALEGVLVLLLTVKFIWDLLQQQTGIPY